MTHFLWSQFASPLIGRRLDFRIGAEWNHWWNETRDTIHWIIRCKDMSLKENIQQWLLTLFRPQFRWTGIESLVAQQILLVNRKYWSPDSSLIQWLSFLDPHESNGTNLMVSINTGYVFHDPQYDYSWFRKKSGSKGCCFSARDHLLPYSQASGLETRFTTVCSTLVSHLFSLIWMTVLLSQQLRLRMVHIPYTRSSCGQLSRSASSIW